jgi:hypothetical protein
MKALQEKEVGEGRSHSEAVHCVQFLDASRLASQSSDGRCVITSLLNNQQIATWRVSLPLSKSEECDSGRPAVPCHHNSFTQGLFRELGVNI